MLQICWVRFLVSAVHLLAIQYSCTAVSDIEVSQLSLYRVASAPWQNVSLWKYLWFDTNMSVKAFVFALNLLPLHYSSVTFGTPITQPFLAHTRTSRPAFCKSGSRMHGTCQARWGPRWYDVKILQRDARGRYRIRWLSDGSISEHFPAKRIRQKQSLTKKAKSKNKYEKRKNEASGTADKAIIRSRSNRSEKRRLGQQLNAVVNLDSERTIQAMNKVNSLRGSKGLCALIAAGMLKAGRGVLSVVGHTGSRVAELTEDGRILYQGSAFLSLSGFAMTALDLAKRCNGWTHTLYKAHDSRNTWCSLDSLRSRL